MACSPKLIINGYEIVMNFGTSYCDGIVVDPHHHDLSDPEFIEAIQVAQSNYDTLYKYFLVDEYASQFYNSTDQAIYKYMDNHPNIAEMQEKIDIALSQSWLEITPSMQRFIDIVAQIINDRKVRAERKQEKSERRKKNAVGFVYLLSTSLGHYKIGHTKNPKSRLSEFSVKLPFDIECECLIKTKDRYALEQELHERFDDKRVNGEWFELEPGDVEYIQSLAVLE